MYVRVFHSQESLYVAASFSEGRIALAEYEPGTVIGEVRLPHNCLSAFDISLDRQLLASGSDAGANLWDLKTGQRLAHLGRSRTSVKFGPDASYLVVQSTRSGFVRHLQNGTTFDLNSCDHLVWSALWNGGLLIPARKNGSVLHLTFNPITSELRPMNGVQGRVHTIQASPTERTFVLFAGGTTLLCFSDLESSPKWSTIFPDIYNWLSFSGDGKLIAVSRNDPEQTLVVDAERGTVLRTYAGISGGTSPLTGSKVMTMEGLILDLATGEIEKGVTRPEWWRSAGLRKLVD